MKSQLLEDLGDSCSQPDVAAPAAPPPAVAAPRPKVWRARLSSPRPVWRARATAELPVQIDPVVATRAPAPLSAPAPSASPFVAPAPSPAPASTAFSAPHPDPLLHLPGMSQPVNANRRWRWLGLGAAAVVACLLGAGVWLYQDAKVVTTLALVAGETEPLPAIAPYVPPAPEPAPRMVLAAPQRGNAAPQPAPEMDDSRTLAVRVADSADALDEDEEATPAAQVAAPAAASATKPRVAPQQPKPPAAKAAARDDKPARTVSRKSAAREVSAKDAPRKDAAKKTAARGAPPKKPGQQAQSAPALSHAETLRQCRAAGYHASQCMRRGCVATKFGLACRG